MEEIQNETALTECEALNEIGVKTRDHQEFKTTPYRWVVASAIFGLIFNVIMSTQIFAAVSVDVSIALQISIFWVTFSMVSANLVIVPMNFVASSLYNAM